MLKMELYTSKLTNSIIHDPSIDIGGLKINVSLGLLSLNSNNSSAFP